VATEKELFGTIRSILLAGFAALDIEIGVKQANQPTQQGVPSTQTVFMALVTNHRFGSPQRSDEWDVDDAVMRHTELQQYESTFQLTGLATQDPTATDQLTAGDLINYAAYIMQNDTCIATLRDLGWGIERVTDIRNPYFQDDRDRFEASPSFDFVITHKQVVASEVPVLQSTEFQIFEV
jgi:hypothetical protein